MRKLLTALALVAASTACAAADEPAAAPSPPSLSALPTEDNGSSVAAKSPEDPAPDFTITTFDGERFSLGEQRGTPVVLNFWESW